MGHLMSVRIHIRMHTYMYIHTKTQDFTTTMGRRAGLGMNPYELKENKQLSEYTVQNLNKNTKFPYEVRTIRCVRMCKLCVYRLASIVTLFDHFVSYSVLTLINHFLTCSVLTLLNHFHLFSFDTFLNLGLIQF
jgi:hypothetical protein